MAAVGRAERDRCKLGTSIAAVHPGEDLVVAALQRNMQMGHEVGVARDQFEQGGVHLGELD